MYNFSMERALAILEGLRQSGRLIANTAPSGLKVQ